MLRFTRSDLQPAARRALRELERVCSAAGITRLARVTGLDRAGVEVACAVRPGGHVLQVSNGKGRTLAQAFRSAASEAAELHAAEQVDVLQVVTAAPQELEGERWGPELLGGRVAAQLGEQVRQGWVRAQRVDRQGAVWVPAQLVWCPPASGPFLGPLVGRWTTNGLAAHPLRARALRHALLEVWERHALHQVLPEGWGDQAASRRVAAAAQLTARLEAVDFAVGLFDLTPAGARVPVAGALLIDRQLGAVPLTAGYAAREDFEAAAVAALEEAAQSRLTEIHGAREEIAVSARSEAASALAWLGAVKRRAPRRRPVVRRSLRALALELGTPVAFVALRPRGLPLHVVKVFARGFEVSELLR